MDAVLAAADRKDAEGGIIRVDTTSPAIRRLIADAVAEALPGTDPTQQTTAAVAVLNALLALSASRAG